MTRRRPTPAAAAADTPLVVMGFDPGASGGVAVLSPEGAVAVRTPPTRRDLWELVRRYGPAARGRRDVYAYVEQVGGFMGRVAGEGGREERNHASAHTMFRFGRAAEAVEAFLTAADVPYELVPPQRWQRGPDGAGGLGIPPRRPGEGRAAWKGRLREHARLLFPDLRVTSAVADALLIAEWGRRRLAAAGGCGGGG